MESDVRALYTGVLYRPYNELPKTGNIGPTVLVRTIEYFESTIDDFADSLAYLSILPATAVCPNRKETAEGASIYSLFRAWLEALPSPFIPKDLVLVFNAEPSPTSAQMAIASLPSNKRTVFNHFVRVLRSACSQLMHPVDMDKVFGRSFTREKTNHLFNYLSQQDSALLCFPFSSITSFVPKHETYGYPELDTLDFTALNAVVPAEAIPAPSENVATRIAALYADAKVRAQSFGITDEVIENVDDLNSVDCAKMKSEMKRILYQFESEYKALVRRKPTKTDKVPLTPLYVMHMKLRKRSKRRSVRDELLAEKVALQRELNAYREQFERNYGHRIERRSDRAPVQDKYDRYREVKRQLTALDAQ